MPSKSARNEAVGDLILCLFVVVGAAVLFIGASTLPPPRFEPLGSAAMPRILGTTLLFFAAIVAVQAVMKLRRPEAPSTLEDDDVGPSRFKGAVVLLALIGYVAALDLLRVPFLVATPVFVAITGTAIHRPSIRSILLHATLGLGLAFGISTVFSRFLGIGIG